MLISMNWISEFTDLSGVDLKDLINRFTLSAAEVEEVYEMGKDIKDVVVGKLVDIKDHPNSKKLHIVTVDIGTDEIECVCGAPNIFVGAIVPFAKLGGQVGDLEIKEVEIAGVKSSGMCCSEAELGISDDNSGLMILEDKYELGTDIKEFMQLDDLVFEVDNKSLTNRPDLWGHYGIAREISVLTERPLKPIDLHDTEIYKDLEEIDIDIEDKDKAFRFSCIKADNITRKSSPINMKIRLTYCGMRPINLLADLTNYLMLELGQPMHAYDSSKVSSIRVKTFDKPFTFTTLDGEERKIDTETLMICDDQEPVGIAGVMGGALSEIVDDTDSVLLESANFDAATIRRSATRLGLRSDASARYEKTLDPELTSLAIERFLKLLLDINPEAKLTSRLSDNYAKRYDTVKITFDKKYVDKTTGIDIKSPWIEETLTALGFKVSRKDDNFEVIVPSWRATKDVTIKADIIEEITRIYGYDNFEIRSTKGLITPVHHSKEQDNEYRIKELLADRYSMNEVHSYIWYETKNNKELGIKTEPNIRVVNSLTAENDTIRSTMIPSLLGFIPKNLDYSSEIRIFEIGRVAEGLLEDGMANERKRLGIVITSKKSSEKDLYFKLKEIIEQVIMSIKNIRPTFAEKEALNKYNYVHPVNSAAILLEGKDIGYFSLINPRVKDNIDNKLNVAFAEIDILDMESIEKKELEYKEVSRFPGVTVDLSLIVDKSLRYENIVDYIEEYESKYLNKFYLVDIFEDRELPSGKHSMTIRFEFVAMDRTLKGEEIKEMVDKLLEVLNDKDIELRH